MSIVVSRESPGHPATNSVLFEKCWFNYNQASIAAAVDVSVFQPDLIMSNSTLMEPVFKDCQFVRNSITFTDALNSQKTMGAVYANLVPLNFIGTTKFTANDGTALVVSGTYVSLAESSVMIFEGNIGRHGGALAFIENSWLVVHKNAHVTFQNNSAEGHGGAVYSVHYGEHDLMYKQSCFFQYYKATLPPSKWNATFRFTGNSVKNKPNSIYTTSLLPCIWPNAAAIMPQMNDTFCGHPWIYDNESSCVSEVSTGPSNINRGDEIFISAVPGWTTWFNATTLNDYGTQVPSVFTAAPMDVDGTQKVPVIEVSNATEYIADNNIIVYGVANTRANLLLKTLDPRVISSQLVVDIMKCPFGYKQINCTMPGREHMVCNCICTNHVPGVGCDSTSHTIKFYSGTCLSYWYNGTDIDWNQPAVSGRCPYVPEDLIFPHNISYNSSALSRGVCGSHGMHRTGVLCSQCLDGYGVDVNDYRFPCVKCHARYSWLLYILAELFPIIVFFIVVALFNISVTSAPMNAFVFFSQIVTVPFYHNPYTFMFGYLLYTYSTALEAFVAFPYAIWNLNFFAAAVIPGFCLHEGLGTLEVIALKYLNAFLPFLLIIICYILIELHGRNCRCIRFMWRPFRSCLKKIYKNREPKTSIIDAIATFLLLSYSKLLYVSFSLFAPTSLYNALTGDVIKHFAFYFDASTSMFHGKYAVLSITACIVFALFVALPPLFFILYPLKCSQKVIDKLPFRIALRTFAEAFNGDFRDGTYREESGSGATRDCRHYAGYYFLFRVVVFAIFVSELDWLEQYFIQQVFFIICVVLFAIVKPYKENFYNKLDIAMFTLLAILNAFSLYNSQRYKFHSRINGVVFWINYLLIFLPLVYIIGYCCYLILLWKGCIEGWTKSESPMSENTVVSDPTSADGDSEDDSGHPVVYVYSSRRSEEDIPDRLVNPQNYNSRNLYRPHDQNVAALSRGPPHQAQHHRRSKWLQGSSERSYLYGKRDKKLVPYGSFSTPERHSEPILRPGHCERSSDGNDGRNSSGKGGNVCFQGVV